MPDGADSDAVTTLDADMIAAQEKEMAAMGDISARQLIDLMKKMNEEMDSDKILIMEYTTALNWWVATLRHLGSAIAVAFKDTKDKAKDMINNRKIFIEELKIIAPDSAEANYLIPFCGEEAKYGI